ncbi:hypothetical protein cypCar_00000028, partial [Cyprinus carpio]
PVIVIGGSSDRNQETTGAFQEFPQVGLIGNVCFDIKTACLYSKFSNQPSSLEMIPAVVEKAVRSSIYGRPEASYIDIAGEMVIAKIDRASVRATLQADVIVLLGARLNWILHFGFPPSFIPYVKIIQ